MRFALLFLFTSANALVGVVNMISPKKAFQHLERLVQQVDLETMGNQMIVYGGGAHVEPNSWKVNEILTALVWTRLNQDDNTRTSDNTTQPFVLTWKREEEVCGYLFGETRSVCDEKQMWATQLLVHPNHDIEYALIVDELLRDEIRKRALFCGAKLVTSELEDRTKAELAYLLDA